MKTVKRIAWDTIEVLEKRAKETVLPPVPVKPIPDRNEPAIRDQSPQSETTEKKDLRVIEALDREIEDIRHNKLIEEIQAKIQAGETVYFANYPEIPPEQIEILKKQKEEYDKKKEYEASSGKDSLPQSVSKRGRRMSFSRKKAAERETTKTERPLPPSG